MFVKFLALLALFLPRPNVVSALASNCDPGEYPCLQGGVCGNFVNMCKQLPEKNTASCKDEINGTLVINAGYCSETDCNNNYGHAVLANDNGKEQWICILNQYMCDGVDQYYQRLKTGGEIDENMCPNGGKCESTPNPDYKDEENKDYYSDVRESDALPFLHSCSCADGYTGKRCENKDVTDEYVTDAMDVTDVTDVMDKDVTHKDVTDKPEPTGPMGLPTNQPSTGKRKCIPGQHANCSKAGYVCPFVDCPICLPCQNRTEDYYLEGDYRGCLHSQKCSERFIIPGPDCNSNCQKKVIVNGTGPLKKCEVEICEIDNSVCPPIPKYTACQELVDQEHECNHCESYVVRDKPFEQIAPMKSCGSLCRRRKPVDGGCDIECVQWNNGNVKQCDEKCQNTIEDSKDESTCSKQISCETISCDDIAQTENKCIVPATLDRERDFKGDSCKCPSGEHLQLQDYCQHCKEAVCETTPCLKPVNKTCTRWEESIAIPCNEDLEQRCTEYCQSSKECQCRSIPSKCPEGMELVTKACPCKKSDKCCAEICPEKLEKNGKSFTQTCVKESCEVCATMEGAELISGARWNNVRFCNADMECCPGCRDAAEVEQCPTNWSSEKKRRCKCKN